MKRILIITVSIILVAIVWAFQSPKIFVPALQAVPIESDSVQIHQLLQTISQSVATKTLEDVASYFPTLLPVS
jgi:hypothetical protein